MKSEITVGGNMYSKGARGEFVFFIMVTILLIASAAWCWITLRSAIFNGICSIFIGLGIIGTYGNFIGKLNSIILSNSTLQLFRSKRRLLKEIIISNIVSVDFELQKASKSVSYNLIFFEMNTAKISIEISTLDKNELLELLSSLKKKNSSITISQSIIEYLGGKGKGFKSLNELTDKKLTPNIIDKITGVVFSILLLGSILLMNRCFTLYSQLRLSLLGLSSANPDVLYILSTNYRQWVGATLVWLAIILLVSVFSECLVTGARPNLKIIKRISSVMALVGIVIIIPYFSDYYMVTGDSIIHVNTITRSNKTYTPGDITGIEKVCYMTKSRPKNPSLFILEYNISLNDGKSFNLFKSNQHAGIADTNY